MLLLVMSIHLVDGGGGGGEGGQKGHMLPWQEGDDLTVWGLVRVCPPPPPPPPTKSDDLLCVCVQLGNTLLKPKRH